MGQMKRKTYTETQRKDILASIADAIAAGSRIGDAIEQAKIKRSMYTRWRHKLGAGTTASASLIPVVPPHKRQKSQLSGVTAEDILTLLTAKRNFYDDVVRDIGGLLDRAREGQQ